MVDHALLRPETKEEEPNDQGNDHDRDRSGDQSQPSLGRPGIVLLRIQQSHKSVSSTARILKTSKEFASQTNLQLGQPDTPRYRRQAEIAAAGREDRCYFSRCEGWKTAADTKSRSAARRAEMRCGDVGSPGFSTCCAGRLMK